VWAWIFCIFLILTRTSVIVNLWIQSVQNILISLPSNLSVCFHELNQGYQVKLSIYPDVEEW
jgi:hypothetical protein